MSLSGGQPNGGIAEEELVQLINESRVIGLLPSAEASQYTLLYVTSIDAPETTTDSPIHVHSVQLNHGLVNQYGSSLTTIDTKLCALMSTLDSKGQTVRPEVSVILSIESGAKQATDFYDKALKPALKAIGLADNDYKTYTTESEQTISELTKAIFAPRAADGVAQTIVLLSGDGGTIDLMNDLIDHAPSSSYVKPTLVPLPLGSGNALSNSYRYNDDETWGIATLLTGRRRPLPMFRATFSEGSRIMVDQGAGERELGLFDGKRTVFGAVVCSWGLHSTLVAESDTAHYRQFGTARFGMVAKDLLFPSEDQPPHEYNGSIATLPESLVTRDRHSYVLATLVSNLEKTFCISPASKNLDGQLRLIEMPPMPGKELMELMMAGYDGGKHIDSDKVGYHTIDRMEIVFDEADERWRRVCVDGKIIKVEKQGRLCLEKEKLVVADLLVGS